MFHYTICTLPDEEIFMKQCYAFEKHIPNIVKEQLLEDVDCSLTHTKHHLKYRNLFGIFCTALHTATWQGDSLAVDQYSFSTKSAQNSFPDFKRCLVSNIYT